MQRNVAIGTLFVVLLAGVVINVSSLQAASQPGPRCSITGCPKAGEKDGDCARHRREGEALGPDGEFVHVPERRTLRSNGTSGGRTSSLELVRTLRPLVLLSAENLVARVRTLHLEGYEVCDGVTRATRSPSTTLVAVNALPLGPDLHLSDSTRRASWSDPESIDALTLRSICKESATQRRFGPLSRELQSRSIGVLFLCGPISLAWPPDMASIRGALRAARGSQDVYINRDNESKSRPLL